MNQSNRILFALLLGIAGGLLLNLLVPGATIEFLDRNFLTVVGSGFIRLIQFIVVPLVLLSLALAVARMGDLRRIGRYSLKLLGLYLATSSLSLVLGVGLARFMKPGAGVEMAAQTLPEFQRVTLAEWVLRILPRNPFEALSTGNILQVIVTAVLVGLGITLAGKKGHSLHSLFESGYEVVKKMTRVILYLAPAGVFALMASVIATQGIGILKSLALYAVGLILGILLIAGVMYNLIFLASGIRPLHFWKAFSPAFMFAFGTASSGASLPLAMENAEARYGMRPEISSFALPFGIAMKKDGAALLQGFTAVFVAQMAGIDLSPPQMSAVFVSSLLVSFSTAGIPAGGLIMMTTVLTAAGLPLEGVVILAGLDRLTDTFRSSLNVIGPAANAALLERWEKRKERGRGPAGKAVE
jgi:Na+/H+-dicarboxylate symporter